ncbi:YihY/virulence factor BrkB family protein [uncultured Campylobacter sp.]|uniref:YihY/virulence factor BrkB family protein n=2 Tax=uncultured Campylobacter sp. TaxID=218934 RepID=UPI00345010DB
MNEGKFKIACKKALNLALHSQDKSILRYASGLSFYTILFMIPAFLLSLGIAARLPIFNQSKYFEALKNFLFSTFLPIKHKLTTQHLEIFLQNSFELNTICTVAVIFASITFFADYEHAVNRIAKAEKKCNFIYSLSIYWALVALTPICFGFSICLSYLVDKILHSMAVDIKLLNFLSFMCIWAMFCLFYIVSANKKIKFKNTAPSSLIATIAWFASKYVLLYYAILNETYRSIYGSFAVLLFFFLWIYVSWVVFLYGFKFCVFLENKHSQDEVPT